MAITKELLEQMLKAMDKDGDGECSKGEFKETYVSYMQNEGKAISDEEYEAVWKKIDKDGSGDVSVAELAQYYGYDVDAKGHVLKKDDDDMDDDAILEALKLAAHLEIETPKVVEKPPEKIERCRSINMKSAPDDSLEKHLLEEAALGDVKKVSDIVDKMVEKKMSIRIEDTEMGQMPLHKIARVGDKAEALVRKLLEVGGEARRDINYQDSNGKTPLHLAAENKQCNLVKMLLDRGSDPTLTTKTGWNALHSAVHSADLETVKGMLEAPRVKSKKAALVKHADLSGRTALHIAAFRAEEPDMVKLLVDHGADPKASDQSGNNAGALAGKSGRRKSRELLDSY